MSTLIVSLGYERRTVDELISLLMNYKVKQLYDIRIKPISRRKDYNKKALSLKLEEAGVKYIHLKEAGNPFYKESQDIQKCLDLYNDYLKNNPSTVCEIVTQLLGKTTAILCYERDYSLCHRSVLISQLLQHDKTLEVINVE